jgi:hypothetical protein
MLNVNSLVCNFGVVILQAAVIYVEVLTVFNSSATVSLTDVNSGWVWVIMYQNVPVC